MRGAAIDVGSNTVRLLIGEIRDRSIVRIHSDRKITRLAEGLRNTGELREENMKRSVAALKTFSLSIAAFGATCVSAVGTSALREAGNSREFVDRAFRETGIKIEVIPGVREAELTEKGVMIGLIGADDASLIIDIGGGSTEWILHKAGPHEAPLCGSLPTGVVNLFENFIKTDPPSDEDVSALNSEIDSRLRLLGPGPRGPGNLIGTGGTITTLASIDLGLTEYGPERIHSHRIPKDRLYLMRDRLLSLPLSKRRELDGLEPERADLIIPGILLTIRVVELFGFPGLIVSDYGLLEGLLKEMEDSQDTKTQSHKERL